MAADELRLLGMTWRRDERRGLDPLPELERFERCITRRSR
jgi:hypothetical protein